MRNKLWHNQGDGTFEDVTAQAGLDVQLHATGGGSAHGMAAADFNSDGAPDLDLLVMAPHFLFLNDGQGVF